MPAWAEKDMLLSARIRSWARRKPDHSLTLLEKGEDDEKVLEATYADIAASGKICGLEVEGTWPVRAAQHVPYLLVARDSFTQKLIGVLGFGVREHQEQDGCRLKSSAANARGLGVR